MSSTRAVSRWAAHDMRLATLACRKSLPRKYSSSIPVTSVSDWLRVSRDPRKSHSAEKKRTIVGARSSWRVQPRVNHLLALN